MKKYVLLSIILVLIAGWSSEGLCQQCLFPSGLFWKPFAAIWNVKHSPISRNGTFFELVVLSGNPAGAGGAMNGLVEISALNPESIDEEGVYEFDLTPTLRHLTGEWGSGRNFTGQNGTYEVTIKRLVFPPFPNPPYLQTLVCPTDPIDPNLAPLPIPQELWVSFEAGSTEPTLSFDPAGWVPSGPGEWYQVRIYDKDYSRRIYSVTICTGDIRCSKQDLIPSVTFPENRSGSQTYEALIPGEEYLFRVDFWKELPGSPTPQRNLLVGTNFKSFKVPKK